MCDSDGWLWGMGTRSGGPTLDVSMPPKPVIRPNDSLLDGGCQISPAIRAEACPMCARTAPLFPLPAPKGSVETLTFGA